MTIAFKKIFTKRKGDYEHGRKNKEYRKEEETKFS